MITSPERDNPQPLLRSPRIATTVADMDDPIAALRGAVERAAAGDLLDQVAAYAEIVRLGRRELARAETAALAGNSVSAVARARGVSHQYMSRRARGAAA